MSDRRLGPDAVVHVDLLDVFSARAEARAYLYFAGEFELHEAVDELQNTADRDGLIMRIGQDAVQDIMAKAFGGEA